MFLLEKQKDGRGENPRFHKTCKKSLLQCESVGVGGKINRGEAGEGWGDEGG